MKKLNKKEFVTVTLSLKVDGKLARSKKKTYYAHSRGSYAFTLEDFARIIFMYDDYFSVSGSTYAYDGLLQKMEKKLPKRKDETAKSLFEKYWVNLRKTIDDEFLEFNKGDKNKNMQFPLYPEEGDYLKMCFVSSAENFNRRPLPVKYAFLYWFYKYVMNSSMKEIKDDLNNVPKEIKKMVDNILSKSIVSPKK